MARRPSSRRSAAALAISTVLVACGTTHELATPLSVPDIGAIQKATGPLELAYASPPAPGGVGSALPEPIQPLEARYGHEMRALLGREGDALVFKSRAGAPVVIPERDLKSIDARNHLAGAGYGLLLGLLTGAAAGAVVGASQTPCSTDSGGCGRPPTRVGGAVLDAILFGVVGTAAGTIAGAAIGTRTRFQLRSEDADSTSATP